MTRNNFKHFSPIFYNSKLGSEITELEVTIRVSMSINKEEKIGVADDFHGAACQHVGEEEDKSWEDDLMALDRFLQCREESSSTGQINTNTRPPISEATMNNEEDEESRQKRFFQLQVAKLKASKASSTQPSITDENIEGHSLIALIKAKFHANDQDKAMLDAWSTDFHLSNNKQEEQNMIEHNEGDLLLDELLDDDEEVLNKTQDELERSTTPYSWRFDEAAPLELKVDNFVDDNDDFDFSSAYMPTSLLLKSQQDTADKTTTSSSDEAAATAVAISDSDLLVQSETTVDTVAEDIETLEFEEDSDEEDESTQAEGFNLREVLAMMNMLGAGKHEQDRMQSIALALQQGLSYAEMQFDSNGNDDNGEVRYFTDVEEFAVEEEADEVVVLHHNNNAENMP